MKNSEILALVQGGVLSATQHCVSTSHAYKVFKLKNVVRKLFEGILEQEKLLAAECGISDSESFDARRNELLTKGELTADEKKELEEMNKKFADFATQRAELYDEDADISSIKQMPYEEWHKLQNENKAVVNNMGREIDVFSGIVEELLFGVLWNAPDEE